MNGRCLLLLVFSCSFSHALEVAKTEIDLGEIGPDCVESPFFIRAKSSLGECPLIEATCGCLKVRRDKAIRDDDGWWNIPVAQTFGTGSGREIQSLLVSEGGESTEIRVKVVSNVQMVASLAYTGILMWSTTEKSKRSQSVDLVFSKLVTVTSVKVAQRDGATFSASVTKANKDSSRWQISVAPKSMPMRQTVFPDMIRIDVECSSPRVKRLMISAMAIPPEP